MTTVIQTPQILPDILLAQVSVERLIILLAVVIGCAALMWYFLKRKKLFNKAVSALYPFSEDIIESSFDMFVSIDEESRILRWNKQAELVFGWTKAEALGKHLPDMIMPPEAKESHLHGLKRFLETGQGPVLNARVEVKGVSRSGREIPLELSVTPMKQDNGRYVFNAFLHDISQRKELERLKDDFVSTVSHELRTPIAILKEGIDLLKNASPDDLKPEHRRIVDICHSNSRRMIKMINNLLDMSRFESGHAKMTFSLFDIHPLIKDVMDGFKIDAASKNLEMMITPSQKTLAKKPAHVFGDQSMIVQILDNLIGNAVRYAKSIVEVKVLEETGSLHVSIFDDGMGIESENIKYLFNKFRQFNRPQGGAGYQGTGLGLAICKEIIDLHEGKIWAESDADHGSTFHFTIPLRGLV